MYGEIFTDEELNLISDGLEDTLIRLKTGQIKEDYLTYTKKIIVLQKKVTKCLKYGNKSNRYGIRVSRRYYKT